jgi:hypothetical protein
MKMILSPAERNTVEIQVILYKTVFDLLLNYGDGIYALVDPKVEGFNVSCFSCSFLCVSADFPPSLIWSGYSDFNTVC